MKNKAQTQKHSRLNYVSNEITRTASDEKRELLQNIEPTVTENIKETTNTVE